MIKTQLPLLLLASAACAKQPNIIFVLADDLGYMDLVSYAARVNGGVYAGLQMPIWGAVGRRPTKSLDTAFKRAGDETGGRQSGVRWEAQRHTAFAVERYGALAKAVSPRSSLPPHSKTFLQNLFSKIIAHGNAVGFEFGEGVDEGAVGVVFEPGLRTPAIFGGLLSALARPLAVQSRLFARLTP
ncbi:hypothetical protein PDESU_01544 [Pontiella desulfatans]|uniref:Sulfatase N-terminal domain-containing protein n=1 Tax=Pontiella desulfatans TaxID=2750659 RepID=A0A6C2TZ75_PONDE|nr:hypothetical protein [Pontiella desulfatans]VGO12990.1 hypothetical protein PDESU_01544 [Pontiella desulfatans]